MPCGLHAAIPERSNYRRRGIAAHEFKQVGQKPGSMPRVCWFGVVTVPSRFHTPTLRERAKYGDNPGSRFSAGTGISDHAAPVSKLDVDNTPFQLGRIRSG